MSAVEGGDFIVCANSEGHLCSRFIKYCSINIVTLKHYNYILIGMGNIVSHVVLIKMIANTPHNKNKIVIADILQLEGLEVSD